MNKDPIASAVMAAATKVRAHCVQRADQTFRRACNLALEAQVTNRQVVGEAKEILNNADRAR